MCNMINIVEHSNTKPGISTNRVYRVEILMSSYEVLEPKGRSMGRLSILMDIKKVFVIVYEFNPN